MKTCRKCGEAKDFSEFNKRKSSKDGLYSYCRLCSNAANRDAIRVWKVANPDKLRGYTLNARAENPHRDQAYSANTRARKLGVTGTISANEWKQILDGANGVCPACERSVSLSLDHIVPFAMGGSNVVENIQAICLDCNQSKGAKIEDYR